MNKKFLGISALLALILSSCGGTPSVDPSGSSVEPTTSETSSEGGSDTTSTTSEETPVALNDVLDKLESLGHVYEGKITIGNEVLILKQNANFTYLKGVGGIGKIVPMTPVDPEGGEEGGQEGGEQGGQEGGEEGGQEGLEQGVAHIEFNEKDPAVMLRRALADGEEETEEEELAEKYFLFAEGLDENQKQTFLAKWGAFYESQDEFILNNTAGGLGATLKAIVAQMTPEEIGNLIAYNKAGKFYQIKNASFVNAFASLVGINLLGVNLAKFNLSFDGDQFKIGFYQTAVEATPSINVVLEAKPEVKDEALENWLLSFSDYPHSPVSLADVLDKFNTVNYHSEANLDDLDPQYDLTLGFSATENGYGIASLGESWQDKGTIGGVLEVSEKGYELERGYYGYDTAVGGAIDIAKLESLYDLYGYEYEGKWYDMWANPSFVGYNKDTFGANPVETFDGFYIDNPTYVNYMARHFRGINAGATVFTFNIKDNPRVIPDGYALETITKPKELYINYTLDEKEEVDSIEITAELALYDVVYLATDKSKTEVASLSGWNEVAIDDRYEIIETYTDFGTTVTEADKFVGESLRKVVFDEEKIAKEIVLDKGEKASWSLEGKYTPAELGVSYYAYFEDGTISVDAKTGEVEALNPGYDYVTGVVGGAEIEAKVYVRGILAYDLESFAYVEAINTFPGEEVNYGLDIYKLDNAPEVASKDTEIATAEIVALHEDEEDAEKVTGYELKVNALKNGETSVTVSISENDKTYELVLPVSVSPDVKFGQDDAFVGVGKNASVPLNVFASEVESFAVKSSNEEILTATFDEENKEVDLVGVAAGTVTLEVSMVVAGETYKDSIKVSVSDNTFVGSWLVSALADENGNYGYITLHEDKSVLFTLGEQSLEATWKAVEQEGEALNFACTIENLDLTSLGLTVTAGTTAYDVMDIVQIAVQYPDTNAAAKIWIGAGSNGEKVGNLTTRIANLYVEELPVRASYTAFFHNGGNYDEITGLTITIYNDGYVVFQWVVSDTLTIKATGYVEYSGVDSYGDPCYEGILETDSEELPLIYVYVGLWNRSYNQFMFMFGKNVEGEFAPIEEGLPEGADLMEDTLGQITKLY